MKVEIIHEKTIKPSSPTPSHLTTSKFSFFDQLAPDVYDQILLFYPSSSSTHSDDHDHFTSLAKRSQVLKTSLSEALTHFYVFAGEFKDNVAIKCNDQGALFVEARVNCPLSKILDYPGLGMQNKLVPNGMEYKTQSGTRYVLLVQANFFDCGGLAIAVGLSHKVADASTLGTFISSWAATALGSGATADIGAASSHFPPLDFLNSPDISFSERDDVVTRRFVFHAPMIAALKSKAASTAVPNPTRVEVVSAFIWNCAMEASRSNAGLLRPSAYNQAVNIRKILLPPLGQDAVGNLFSSFTAKTEVGNEDDLQSLVAKLRTGLDKFKLRYANGITAEEFIQLSREFQEGVVKDDTDIYYSSSLWGPPFYSANFGWGRPTWLNFLVDAPFKNLIVLVDMSDGIGIEATVTLKLEDMALFQNNQELLAFTFLSASKL